MSQAPQLENGINDTCLAEIYKGKLDAKLLAERINQLQLEVVLEVQA